MLRCIITATKALPLFLRFYSFLYKKTPKSTYICYNFALLMSFSGM